MKRGPIKQLCRNIDKSMDLWAFLAQVWKVLKIRQNPDFGVLRSMEISSLKSLEFSDHVFTFPGSWGVGGVGSMETAVSAQCFQGLTKVQ